MKKILIIGATSAIAEACARAWVTRGDRVALAGRNAARLHTIAADLAVRAAGGAGAADVPVLSLDVNDLSQHAGVLAAAAERLGGLDVVLLAHGTLPDQAECAASVDRALQEIATNGTSTVALMTLAGQRLAAQGRGTIAVISSVAGDRGRASNYVYGSAKALVSAFASGQRQSLRATGVHVMTIKPGFVDTPMTAAFRKGPLWAKPAKVAQDIVRGVDRGRNVVYTPGFWWLIMAIIRSIPEAVFVKLKL